MLRLNSKRNYKKVYSVNVFYLIIGVYFSLTEGVVFGGDLDDVGDTCVDDAAKFEEHVNVSIVGTAVGVNNIVAFADHFGDEVNFVGVLGEFGAERFCMAAGFAYDEVGFGEVGVFDHA